MNCKKCGKKAIRYGNKEGIQSYRCKSCGYYFKENTKTRLTDEQKQEALDCLLSGQSKEEVCKRFGISVRSIQRITKKAREE